MKTAFVSEGKFDQGSFLAYLASCPEADINKYELIDGRIIMNPPAGWPHGEAEVHLSSVLRRHVKERDLGIVAGPSQGYELPTGHTVSPDASVLLKERLEKGPTPERGRFLRIVPNLAAEIISEGSEVRDRTVKLRIYAEAGVEEYWLVDLEREALTVYHLLPGGIYDSGESFQRGQKVRSRVLAGLNFPADELFPRA